MTRLVATKLGIHARQDRIVSRDRLNRLLDAAVGARLVLVSAPPGFGKSSLLADWVARSGIRAAWLSLDAADNDLVRFLRYLEAAVARLGPEPADVAPEAVIGDLESAVSRLVDALAGSGVSTILVLDDYHVITSRLVHETVAVLLERLPEHARLAIATRADPPLPIARLRARGELVEIRADALRFTEDEVTEWLGRQLEGGLDPSAVGILTRRTEGWAAVIQLAAVSLRGAEDRGRLIREFGASHRFVLDFVADEVLGGLDERTRTFLLETSVLERLSGPACDGVTGTLGGSEMLEALERANLLVVPLDSERRWYRYHHLFHDLLRSRLAAADPGRPAVLHRRAAEWHESAGYLDEAIRHAFQAGDIEDARRLVRRHWLGWLHAGETWTVQHWLDAFPAGLVASDPQLSAVYGWALALRGESAGVADWIERASTALARPDVDPLDRVLVPSQLACLRSNLAQLAGDGPAQLEHAREALAMLPDEGSVPAALRGLLEGDATLLVAHGLVATGQTDAATDAFRRALPLLRRGGNMIASSHAVLSLAALEIRRGRADAALELARSALAEAWNPAAAYDALEPATAAGIERAGSRSSDESPGVAAVHVASAEALTALGRYGEARVELTRATELGRRGEGRALALAAAATRRLDDAERAGAAAAKAAPGSHLVEPLTGRELEVLRLVAAGRSNRQIADELFVAVGTVKAHLHTICGKLGAENRVQAILRGRDEGLLG